MKTVRQPRTFTPAVDVSDIRKKRDALAFQPLKPIQPPPWVQKRIDDYRAIKRKGLIFVVRDLAGVETVVKTLGET